MKYDLTVIGHIVLDDIESNGQLTSRRPGGPCVYASLAARALDASVKVISKVGWDFGEKRLSWFSAQGMSISRIRISDSHTTSFRISYRNGYRKMKVTSICDPLESRDLANLPSSSTTHIGPVLDEISPSLAIQVTKSDSIVSLDPQGYLRHLTRRGSVKARRWMDRRLLKRIAVLKVSESELPFISAGEHSVKKLKKLGPGIVLLTRGARGLTLWSEREGMFRIPAFETEVKDPTGAGDALAGAFLVTLARTGDLFWSASVGTALASFLVARTRALGFGTRRQIQRRALRIVDSISRM